MPCLIGRLAICSGIELVHPWQVVVLQSLLPATGLPPLLSLRARRPRYGHVPTQRSAPPKCGLSRTLVYSSHQTVLAIPLTCDSVAPELLVVVLLVRGRYVSILG